MMNMNQFLKKIKSIPWGYKFTFRMITSASLMAWLLSKVNLAEVVERWKGTNWPLLILITLVIQLAATTVRALRLSVILRTQGIQARIWWLVFIQLRGVFLKSFLPGGIAEDIYKTYVIGRESKKRVQSLFSVMGERAMGLAAMLMLSSVGLVYGLNQLDHPRLAQVKQPVLIVTAGFFATGFALVAIVRTRLIHKINIPSRLWKRMQQIVSDISPLFSNTKSLMQLAVLSFLLQMIIIIWYFLIAKTLKLDLSIFVLVMTIPLVELLVMLPLSIGGIGFRDSAFVFLFLPLGLTAADAISYSLLSFVISTIVGASAGITFLFDFKYKQDLQVESVEYLQKP